VSLPCEIEWIEQYVELQQIRYDDRLEVDIYVAPDATAALVPPLVLQPLVENAIKHGVEMQRGYGRIAISAARDGAELVLRVHDDGPGIEREPRDGIGLSNTRDRLRAIYGQATSVDLRESADGGAEAIVTIPFRES
jgi:two-component system LytT family sensor kinase